MGNARRCGRAWAALAVTLAASAVAGEPDVGLGGSAYYYYSLAQQDRFRRDYLDAVEHLKSAVEYDPGSVALHLELARLYWLLGNRMNGFERNAILEAEEATRLDPDSADAHRFLASVYTTLSARGRGEGEALEKAIHHHERALALDPRGDQDDSGLNLGKLYLQAGRIADAQRALEAFVQSSPDSVEGLFWLSQAHRGLGRLDDAVAPLQRALDLSPRSFNLADAMVELQEERRDWDAAIEAAHRLVDLAPDDAAHHLRLARLYRLGGRPLQALDVYDRTERALGERGAEVPDAVLAVVMLGRSEALVDAGRGTEALSLLAEGSNRFPADVRFPLIRAQLRYRLGDPEGGERSLRQLLEEHPGDAALRRAISSAALGLGDFEMQAGRLDACERLLEWSLEIEPENHRALNYLGYLWADQGKNLDRSVRYIQRALRIGGENGAYLDSLGWAYYRMARYDLAEDNLVRAVRLSADEPEILNHLGDLYRATRRPREAVETWRRAIEAGSEDAEAIRGKIQAVLSGAEPSR
jgi:tetratricopeptide (TPR) repeat protein